MLQRPNLERRVELLSDERVPIRPLMAADAELYPDFLADVTAEDLRLLFFSAMRTMAPELIDKRVHYDPKTAMAFIAIEEARGRMLGVVRLHNDESGENGEFAILTRSHMKGHGLGWLMMKHMIAYAKAAGLKSVRGQVLAENTTMLQMCGQLGFHSTNEEERGVKFVELPLIEVSAEALS